MRTTLKALLVTLLCATGVAAQGPAPAAGQGGAPGAGRGGGQQGPQVVSPQVNADRTVTLRLLAPQATEVRVTGEILNGAQPTAMTKGADGIWTATLGPLPVDIYTYAFNVDGVNTTDPRNPWVKLVASTGLASQVQVPGDGLQYYDAKPVPHGLVQILTYESKSAGAARQAYVYTPPGYHQGTTRYPVLYLLHGGGDLDPGWTMTGRANFIMDNLIADGRSVPMIVVMPLGRGGGSLGVGPAGLSPGDPNAAGNPTPGGGRAGGAGGGAAAPPAGPAALGAFAQDFYNDLMPTIERTFRTRAGRDSRAMAGLSAGGAATVNTVFSRPEMFGAVVIMSAGAGQNVEASYPNFFGNNAAGARQLKLVWVGVGDQDFALNGSRTLSESLTKAGVKHEFVLNEGYRHEWRLWRLHMTQFVPLLFK